MNFDEWLKQNATTEDTTEESEEVKTRAEVSSVAKYYSDYVKIMKLEKFFKTNTIVFKITQAKKNEKNNGSEFENARWLVHR